MASSSARVKVTVATSLSFGAVVLVVLSSLLLWNFAAGPSVLVAAAAFVAVTSFIAILFRYEPLFFVGMALFILGQGGALFSGVLIEGGAYVSEEHVHGFPTGATTELAFYFVGFLMVALIVFHRLMPRRQRRGAASRRLTRNWRILAYIAAALAISYGVLGLMINGSPLLEHIPRYGYWRTNRLPLLHPIHNQFSTLAFLMGIGWSMGVRRGERVLIASLVAAMLCYFVFEGEKFTALIVVGFSFLLPILARRISVFRDRSTLARAGWIVVAAGGLLGVLVVYQYATVFANRSPLAMVQERVVLQGHVWWGVERAAHQGALPVPPAIQRGRELAAFVDPRTSGGDVGMPLLMRTVAPSSVVDAYLSEGVRFTMGYPAIALYLFGPYVLVVLQAIAAALTAILLAYLLRNLLRGRYLRALLGYKIFFEVYGILTIGNLADLISYKMLAYIAVAIFLEVVVLPQRSRHAAVHS